MDWKLELIVVPVSDVDRAKAFYMDQAGFHLDVDHSAGEDFRVVQLTPPGSACSIALMRNEDAPGSLNGLQLVVPDIEAARNELAGRGVEVERGLPLRGGPAAAGSRPGARRLQLVPVVQRPRRHRLDGPGAPAVRGRRLTGPAPVSVHSAPRTVTLPPWLTSTRKGARQRHPMSRPGLAGPLSPFSGAIREDRRSWFRRCWWRSPPARPRWPVPSPRPGGGPSPAGAARRSLRSGPASPRPAVSW